MRPLSAGQSAGEEARAAYYCKQPQNSFGDGRAARGQDLRSLCFRPELTLYTRLTAPGPTTIAGLPGVTVDLTCVLAG